MKQQLNAQDKAMQTLLARGCPIALGIPAWMLRELTTRAEYPIAPDDLLGMSKEITDENAGLDLVTDYMDLVGYQFSRGRIEEQHSPAEDGMEESCTFEVLPEALLKMLPRSDILEDVMISLYQAHPLASDAFLCDDAGGSWTVMQFVAFGSAEIKALRAWLASTFIPSIWPDLQNTMADLITVGQTDEQKFVRESTEWFIGKKDTSDLHMLGKAPATPQSEAPLH